MEIQINIQIEVIPTKVWKPIKWVSTKNYGIEDWNDDGTPSYVDMSPDMPYMEDKKPDVEVEEWEESLKASMPMEVKPKRTRNPFKMGRIH